MRERVKARAHEAAESRVIDALAGEGARDQTREMFRRKLRSGELDDKEIELEVADTSSPFPMMEIPGQPGVGMGALNLGDIFGKAFGGGRKVRRRLSVAASYELADHRGGRQAARPGGGEPRGGRPRSSRTASSSSTRSTRSPPAPRPAAPTSRREGVQRDLLPLIEGTTVSTKYGPVQTDHILFIASGAFHIAKPSDLLPELQGRLPIRVELRALTEADFVRILTETDNALTRQYTALMATEGVEVDFTADGIAALARIAAEVNRAVENIGARRLHTVLERVFEDLSFTAPDRSGDAVTVDAAFVETHLGELSRSADLSRYVL